MEHNTEQEIKTFKILEARLPEAEKRFDKLSRKAAKLGVPAPVFRVVRLFKEERKKYDEISGRNTVYFVKYAEVEIQGPPVKAGEYTFIATLQHTEAGNSIRKTPAGESFEIPMEYRTVDRKCDHCHTLRRRIDTFLVTDGKGWKQVGRNCLGDFLGKNPESIVWGLSWWGEIARFGDDEWHDGLGRGQFEIELESFLKAVFHVTRKEGWVSRQSAREANGTKRATADLAWSLCLPPIGNGEDARLKREEWASMDPNDTNKAVLAATWAKDTFLAKPVFSRSDYEHNMAVALEEGSVNHKNSGILASVVAVYARAMEENLKRDAARADRLNDKFGEVDSRVTLSLQIEKVMALQGGQFGPTFLHIMRDEAGRTFKWFGSKHLSQDGIREAGIGDWVEASWRIKSHEIYKGWNQTLLSRPTKIKLTVPTS